MSWHFSRALVEDCLELMPSDCIASALLKSENTNGQSWPPVKTMGACPRFQSGTTSRHSRLKSIEGLLMSYLAASHVRRLVAQQEGEISKRKTSGRTCNKSSVLFLPVMCSLKTYQQRRSSWRKRTLRNLVTKPKCFPFPRKTWVLTTQGKDFGFLHTPTTKANYAAQSMQKWPVCRNFVQAFGKPTPENQEWLMGLPIGWTDTQPLETDNFLLWRQRLYGHLQMLRPFAEEGEE